MKCIIIIIMSCDLGSCDPCDIDVEVTCFCKREKKVFKCGNMGITKVGGATADGYSCQRMCNKYVILLDSFLY